MPGDLGEIAALPGLGPKRVKLLYESSAFAQLLISAALKAHRLRELRGFAAKSEERLLATLAKPASEKRFKLAVAEEEARSLVDYFGHDWGRARLLWQEATVDVATRLGSRYPRHRARPAPPLEKSWQNMKTSPASSPSPSRTAVVLRSGLHVDLRVVPERSYGAA